MGPSSRSSSSDFSMSPSLPPYKPEEEEEHGEEGEEDVGLLSATSNRLQHIASRRLNGKSGRRHHTSRSWSRLSKLLVPVFTVTALLLGGFAIAGRGIIVHARGSHNGNTDDTGKKKVLNLAGELNGLVPEFEVKPVAFGKDPLATSDHMTEASANATEENWRSYMPAGNGFIAVGNPSQYTLPQPIDFQDQAVYSISVFHQLHCLHTIMQSYNALSEPRHPTSTNHHRDNARRDGHHSSHNDHDQAKPKASHTNHNHIDHCFRYLRQSIVCCGDTALEGQDLNHPDLKATDGTGAVHLCKDYGALKGWTEGRRVTDREGVV